MNIRITDQPPADWQLSCFLSNKVVWFVAYEGEEWVGFGGVEKNTLGAYLNFFYVRHAWRGRGIQRSLIRACEEWAKKQGCNHLTSCTYSDNIVSMKNLEATGFKESRRRFDGNATEVWYEKTLEK